MVVGALFVLTACSGPDKATAPTIASEATTTTARAPTTTAPQDDQVRLAWDGYWAMSDRLLAAPDPDDPELAMRVGEPLLTDLRDDLRQRQVEGRVVVVPDGAVYEHALEHIEISGNEALVRGCEHDDSTTLDAQGETLTRGKFTRILVGSFARSGSAWLATDMGVVSEEPGIIACAV